MAHFTYAREGDVIYRFDERPSRDAWVEARRATRRAIASSEVPFRLKTGRDVAGLELRSGDTGAPEPRVIRRARTKTRNR